MTDLLFTPAKLGAIAIKNRVIMAPMTRSRAGEDEVPNDIMVEYYTQRASAGLIISEGTTPSKNGKGYCRTPGIYTSEQIDGWRKINDSVAGAGGAMVLQIMHCGRVASKYNKSPDSETIAPSSIKARGQLYSDSHGMADFDEPRALLTEEILSVINEYKTATENAFVAGFVGVELHATSGYLPAQFLSTGSNQRTDQYGGSVDNRISFVVETLQAMSAVNGADKVGMRICPGNPFNDLQDDNPEETFTELLKAIDGMGLAYLHVIRMPKGPVDNIALANKYFSGPIILNDSYSSEEAESAIQENQAMAISFGRDFVANPDLVAKLKTKSQLAKFDLVSLYTPGAKGYTDYGV